MTVIYVLLGINLFITVVNLLFIRVILSSVDCVVIRQYRLEKDNKKQLKNIENNLRRKR